MLFINEEHKEFYYLNRAISINDVYSNPVIYLLGLTDDTRNHFNQIYDINNNEIHLEQLKQGWQTGTSSKITRLAFNLFNGMVFDSEDDFDNDKFSSKYAVDKIFCCGFAPFFFEAIKLRYPEYCTNRGIKD